MLCNNLPCDLNEISEQVFLMYWIIYHSRAAMPVSDFYFPVSPAIMTINGILSGLVLFPMSHS